MGSKTFTYLRREFTYYVELSLMFKFCNPSSNERKIAAIIFFFNYNENILDKDKILKAITVIVDQMFYFILF